MLRPCLLAILLLTPAACGQAVDQRERWKKAFANPNPIFNTRPNRFLTETVKGLKPRKALDIGLGQGRNSLWLAQQGWDVTGVDVRLVAKKE